MTTLEAREGINQQQPSVRFATEEDIDAIIEIQRVDGYQHAYNLNPERVRQLMDKKQQFYIASIGDVPLGFACADFDVRTLLHFLSVSLDAQHRGVSTALLNKVVEDSKKHGITTLFFVSDVKAHDMRGFLKDHGFKKAGIHKDRFGLNRNGTIFNLDLLKYKPR